MGGPMSIKEVARLAVRLRMRAANFRAQGDLEKAAEFEEAALLGDKNIEEVRTRLLKTGKQFMENVAPRICAYCGLEYKPTSGSQKYCSEECGAEHRLNAIKRLSGD